jgi:isopentenyl-diphosphate delta-isomerase
VTRRSLGKKAWPGVWTNSVCGHPQSGETFEQAVTRRSRFELGVNIANIASVHPAFRYRAVAPNGLSKTKSARFTPHALSVRCRPIATRSWTISGVSWKIYCALALTPWAYSPWMVLEAADDNARQALRNYVAQLRY